MATTATAAESLTRIHLGGKLGQLFGAEWSLLVASPAEALRAININTRGAFFRYLGKDGQNHFYSVGLGREDQLLEKTELQNRSGNTDIFILPTIKGANSGVGKIIAGVVLIIVGILTSEYGGSVLTEKGAALLGAAFVGLGASLVLGGITQLLTPNPKATQQLQSPNFQGNATSVQQGGCVPIIYGRCLVTPIPVSISFDTADLVATANTQRGTVDAIPLFGGGTQFVVSDPTASDTSTTSS